MPAPTPYARLFRRVYAALEAAGIAVRDDEFFVFGLGDPLMPLIGYCPACLAGIVAIRLLNTDPPRIRTEGCTAGCPPDLIYDEL
jgi:hypothetical protein